MRNKLQTKLMVFHVFPGLTQQYAVLMFFWIYSNGIMIHQ